MTKTYTFDNIEEIELANEFKQRYPGNYLVLSRLTDPLFQRGRARLIWRANTANAIEQLGLKPMLLSSPLPLERGLEADQRVNRSELNQFYGTEFSDLSTMSFINRGTDNTSILRGNCSEMLFGGLLQFVGFIHNRDPCILKRLNERNVPYAYEDHNEDYHVDARSKIGDLLNHDACKSIVAITEFVKSSLILHGVEASKIVVVGSGVSDGAFKTSTSAVFSCRRFHLRNRFRAIAVYTGGLQEERGITHILDAASREPSIKFVLAGGNDSDISRWKKEADNRDLRNVQLAGYLGAEDTWTLQKASDVLLLTRAGSDRELITSPLKYFEYLAVGKPIVHYLPDNIFSTGNTIHAYRYDNRNPETLSTAINKVLKRNWCVDPITEHQRLAENHTWKKRTARILRASLSV